MAVFVDLSDEENDAQPDGQQPWNGGPVDAVKPIPVLVAAAASGISASDGGGTEAKLREEAHGLAVKETLNQNSTTQALGCYPIIMSVAAWLDLNSLDNLSRTCRLVHQGLLQYRKMLLVSTLHCVNERLPVDPDEALRYRARAGNWRYMQDVGRAGHAGKAARCARDLVAECRRCGTVVCRNCSSKPPSSVVLRDRHRRLCAACVAAPLGSLVKPALGPDAAPEYIQRAACTCESEGVWLCQPCGRSIHSNDSEYKGIWKWRNQYTEVLGGLGTGIGDGDRGVICGRESACCAAREREQEMDGDAEDAREEAAAFLFHRATSPPVGTTSTTSTTSSLAPWSLTTSTAPSSPPAPSSPTPSSSSSSTSSALDRRTPSPALKPGYERHEVEGIGGVMKKMRVRMVRVGACVPEWGEERARGEVLGREVRGERRGWCGWCGRVVPGKRELGC